MSSPPTKYARYFDFTNFATLNPEKPLPGASVDVEYDRLKSTTDQIIDRLALIQRDDGALKNAVVTWVSLDADVQNRINNAGLHDDDLITVGALGIGVAPGAPGTLTTLGNATIGNNLQVNGALGVNSVAHFLSTSQFDGKLTGLGGIDITGASIFRTGLLIQGGALTAGVGNFTGLLTASNGLTVVGPLTLPNGSITSAMIGDLNVGTADLADLSVTNPKLALLSVATGNLQDGGVTAPKLSPGAVGTIALADGSVTSQKIADGTIDPGDLSATTLGLITSAGNPRGPWVTGTLYNVKDSVTFGSGVYVCLVGHVAGVFATDLAAGKWMQTGVVYNQGLNTTDSPTFVNLTATGAINATGNITGAAISGTNVTGSGNGQFAKLGLGMAPVNILDITQSVNAVAIAKLLNNNAGNAAYAQVQASNGTDTVSLTMLGQNYTTSNALIAGFGGLISTKGLLLDVASGTDPIVFASGHVEKMRLNSNGVLLVGTTAPTGAEKLKVGGDALITGNLQAQSSNIAKLDNGTYLRRMSLNMGSMASGANYDVVRIGGPVSGNTRIQIKAFLFCQNIQANYCHAIREDAWIIGDSGGTPFDRQYGISGIQKNSINSSVIDLSFSWDFLRSSGLCYVRVWPVFTGASSAGALAYGYFEITISGDGAPGAF